jgi:hypothetical protein
MNDHSFRSRGDESRPQIEILVGRQLTLADPVEAEE